MRSGAAVFIIIFLVTAGITLAQPPAERFVPADVTGRGGTLELRSQATIYGREITLRQIARWPGADAAPFEPMADLVVGRLPQGAQLGSISLDELRGMLQGAGMNLATIRFAGAINCVITRSNSSEVDMPPPSAADGELPAMLSVEQRLTDHAMGVEAEQAARTAAPDEPQPPSSRTLRKLLIEDLSIRLNLPDDRLQVSFNPQDEHLLRLSEPHFRFNLEPIRTRGLGDVGWHVLIVSDGGTQRVAVAATARAWQDQLVLTRPLAFRQIIREGDLTERRVLVDRVADDPLLKRPQAVGQQAARELKPGTVLTARMVDAVPLVRLGQIVSVTLARGGVRVTSVATAMENGTYGQTIRVRNETTRVMFEVIVTGPQAAQMGMHVP